MLEGAIDSLDALENALTDEGVGREQGRSDDR